MANFAVLVLVALFIGRTPTGSNGTYHPSVSGGIVAADALDKLSASDIASHIASITQVDEYKAVTNHADSINLQLAVVPADTAVASKPQVVSTDLKSKKDIQSYTTVEGDTIPTVAAKFGVSSDSVRWSNGITGDVVPSGKQLLMPPKGINGIVYSVKAGDNVDTLTEKYKGNKELLISMNDAEVGGLKEGDRIIIPDGVIKPPPVQYIAPQANSAPAGFAFGNTPIYGRNGYDYGFCTWYAANRVSVPANWGNAHTWASGARASGWQVSDTPRVGAVAWTRSGYLGHVGVVEAVSEDGSQIKYSDMNGLAGWGRVGYSGWVPVHSVFQKFIYQ